MRVGRKELRISIAQKRGELSCISERLEETEAFCRSNVYWQASVLASETIEHDNDAARSFSAGCRDAWKKETNGTS